MKVLIVNLAENPDHTFHIGDKVEVGYDGKIKDKVPIRITLLILK